MIGNLRTFINYIGNDGTHGGKYPIVEIMFLIGVGAKLIGDIKIANNIIIGAGAIVVDSFTEEEVTIARVPARIIK